MINKPPIRTPARPKTYSYSSVDAGGPIWDYSVLDNYNQHLRAIYKFEGTTSLERFSESVNGYTIGVGAPVIEEHSVNGRFGKGYIQINDTGPNLIRHTDVTPPGDFTIAEWIFPQGHDRHMSYINTVSGLITRTNAGGQLQFLYNNTYRAISQNHGEIILDYWQHLAWVREGGYNKIYVDGVEVALSTNSYWTDDISSDALRIQNVAPLKYPAHNQLCIWWTALGSSALAALGGGVEPII